MGFRFTLESANVIANLTWGRISSCYDSIYSSSENYDGFLCFLHDFPQNIYSDKYEDIIYDIYKIQQRIEKRDYHKSRVHRNNEFRDNDILKELYKLSLILDRCHVKSLLLPSFKNEKYEHIDDFMTESSTMDKLLHWHPGNSCLILQPTERLYQNNITIFDAFPNFDIALKQADLWPAVMFWDREGEVAFIPVKHEQELINLYKMIHFERDAINELKRYADRKKEASHYYFHLSDLHLGTRNVEVSERRLKTLIKTQLSTLEIDDKIDFIVTGDAVDSPSKVNNTEYLDFSEFLESKSGKEPIFVLGNHDINRMGLSFKRNNQRIANTIRKYPKIEKNDEIKVIFLLFNSNTNGHLAEGEIGQEQMSEMGNLLDSVPEIEKYKLVAVLHHHVVDIERPNFYDRKWYEKMIPRDFLENSLRLNDADLFLEWMKQRNVKLVLHGHKHIPLISGQDGIYIISCGSSTGQVTHKDRRKTYLSYNVLKFTEDKVVCSQFAEELLGAGVKDIRSVVIDY